MQCVRSETSQAGFSKCLHFRCKCSRIHLTMKIFYCECGLGTTLLVFINLETKYKLLSLLLLKAQLCKSSTFLFSLSACENKLHTCTALFALWRYFVFLVTYCVQHAYPVCFSENTCHAAFRITGAQLEAKAKISNSAKCPVVFETDQR